jgi:alkanesulfonate monooxygenase SsuD/methylene tetrahydromethanopterin reductase-like flavin-dependent oxidoreductase (luciferase family)
LSIGASADEPDGASAETDALKTKKDKVRLGLFLNFEQGGAGPAAEFQRQVDIAVMAEELGFDELWVSEHHFSAFTQSASTLPILGYLAGRMRRIRIGSAAILLPLHDPIRLAEDLATIDILSGGRLNIGLARGGPFPSQYRHFHVAPEDARARADEARDFLLRLLAEENVSFEGRWRRSEDLTIFPRPIQSRLPVWIASSTEATVAESGRRGFGLMAGHAWSPRLIRTLYDLYLTAAEGSEPDFVILRTVCVADTDALALKAAIPALERFYAKMRLHSDAARAAAPISLDASLAAAIIGSPETCRRKLEELQAVAPVSSIVLKIACLDPAMAREVLRRFHSEVAPRGSALVADSGAR